MRRAVMLALALVLAIGVPAMAHDETSEPDYLLGLAAALDIIGDETDDAAELRANYTRAADILLDQLLVTVPADCYRDSYIAAWRLHGDLSRLGETVDVAEIIRLTDYLLVDIEAVTDGWASCPGSSSITSPTTTSGEGPIVSPSEWQARAQAFIDESQAKVSEATDRRLPGMIRGFRAIASRYDDELAWLDANVPDPCFAVQWEDWREAVRATRDYLTGAIQAAVDHDSDWFDENEDDGQFFAATMYVAAYADTDCD